MKLALTTLCENPLHRTALTTMFHEFLGHALRLYPDLDWIIFAGPNQNLGLTDPRIQYVRRFSAGDRLSARLLADHFQVSPLAHQMGAAGLLTVGFVPFRSALPTFMHINSLQHLSSSNQLGSLRQTYRTWMVKRGLQRATLVITNSHSARAQLLSAHPECSDRLFMSHEGTQPQFQPDKGPDEVARLKKEMGLDPGYLLWVSNFYHYKQAPLFIQGYAQLPAEVRQRMPVVMVGGDWDGGLAAAKATAAECGVTENIQFRGWVPEEWLAPLYRNALAFILPSREETFGRCTTEAMACGTPCVLNDIPTNREVSGGHALIINFANRELVTATLRQVYEDASLRERLRLKGMEQAKKFSFENMTRTRIDAILQVLGVKQPAPAGRDRLVSAAGTEPLEIRSLEGAAATPGIRGAEGFDGRLLQIFNCYRIPGGEEHFARQLEDVIGRQQVRTCWFHSRDWIGPGAPAQWKQALLMLNNPAAVEKVMQEHRSWKPAAWLVGNVYPVASLGVYATARKEGIPLIQFVHNFRPFSVGATLWAGGEIIDAGLHRNFWSEVQRAAWLNSRLKSAWMAYVLSHFHRSHHIESVSAWVTVSNFLREKFIQAGIPAERVHTLHPFWFAHKEVPVRPEGDYYLFIGRLIEEKGVLVLLAAWDIILRERGANGPRLIIVGHGPLESRVRAAAAGNPLIEYAGFVTDERKAELIAGCRTMLAPSVWWEALGAVTYEAYDFAKPMLAARSGGLTETVQPGVTGELHEPGNATELAGQILRLDQDPARRAAMGRAGREWLLQNTRPERWREQLFKIVSQVVKSQR